MLKNCESFGLEAVPGGTRYDLAGTHVELTGSIGEWRAVVVDVAKEMGARVADHLGPLSLDAPVV